MNRNRMTACGSDGRLPASAPLANPYVPFQLKNPPKYEPGKAWIRGTLYPGLDLPFQNKTNTALKRVTPISNLQTIAFVLQELALYLDTHRDDQEALDAYRAYQKMYHKCMMEYNMHHRPLNHHTPTDGPYKWLDGPWPWEYCANKEG